MNYGKYIRAAYAIDRMGVDMFIFEQLPEGRFVYEPAGELRRKSLKGGIAKGYVPTMFLEDELAHQLYEALDKIFGKERAVGNTATLEATKYHLEDMRRLAFEPPIEISRPTPSIKENVNNA